MDGKAVSWRWVTADCQISKGPCDLLYAMAVSDGDAPTDNKIYNGESTDGDLIINLQNGSKACVRFSPKAPVYCRRGLYVDVGTNTEGVFIQWLELGHKVGG